MPAAPRIKPFLKKKHLRDRKNPARVAQSGKHFLIYMLTPEQQKRIRENTNFEKSPRASSCPE
jgi:hypothetical protein